MPDYGHDLTLGTFLTPQRPRPQQVVALAQLTETVGLDLATFQDHPPTSQGSWPRGRASSWARRRGVLGRD
jgi:hypothetical protein